MKRLLVLLLAILSVFCFASCEDEKTPSDGKSAYEIWLDQGNTGSEADFLNWLRGADGKNGANGASGADGKSAYDIWLSQGNKGSEADFLNWLSSSQNPQGLDFFPLSDNTYAVSVGNAIYLNEINIPATYNGKKVTVILENGFEGNLNLKRLTIPDTITTIEKNAFANCIALSELTLGTGIKEIGENAFLNARFGTLTISDSVSSIGKNAFTGCSNLKTITVSEDNGSYKSVDNVLYTKDGKALILYPHDKTDTSFTVPNGVTSIEAFAFSNNHYLEGVILPDGLLSIGDEGFGACDALKSIKLPASLTSIGTRAFWSCTSLSSIIIPSNVTAVGERAFYYCPLLTIHCRAQAKPDSWTAKWNESYDFTTNKTIFIPADWGYTGE